MKECDSPPKMNIVAASSSLARDVGDVVMRRRPQTKQRTLSPRFNNNPLAYDNRYLIGANNSTFLNRYKEILCTRESREILEIGKL